MARMCTLELTRTPGGRQYMFRSQEVPVLDKENSECGSSNTRGDGV